MTKRFIQLDSGCDFLVKDTLRNETLYDEKLVDLLNEQHKSIDQLINDEKYWEKKAKQRVKELEEENQRLIKMLDNVANYMQKEHRDMPLDDFVEWWNGIATDGLDD